RDTSPEVTHTEIWMTRRLLVGICLLALVAAQKTKKIDKEDRDGESCGSDAVPYLIEIDQNGKPELYCDTPICLEPPADFRRAKRASTDRSTDADHPTEYPECNHQLLETVCVGEKEWTSGLKEVNNGTHRTLKTECCSYNGLGGAKELKTVLLEAGDRYQGGPVRIHGRERAFDLVKEVRKTVNSDNRVQYVISVYRMPCSASGDDFTPYSRASHQRNRRRMERRELYDDFDYAPRSSDRRKFLDDYDLPPRVLRRMQRRRMMRRRPILEEYYDYDDYVPMRPLKRTKAGARQFAQGATVALGMDDRLWPVNYESQQTAYQTPAGQLPEATDTNVMVQRGEMPMPPPGQDTGMQSLQPLNSMPMAGGGGAGAVYPPGPLPPPGTYATAPESYAQPTDAYTSPRTFGREPVHQIQYQAQPQPQPQQTYSYPAYQSGTGLNGIFDQMQCFSGDLMVQTAEGPKAMRELKTGDEVLSIEENMVSFSPIIMFLHRDEELLAEFNVITTASGESVKLTNEHLIYVTDCNPRSALQLIRAKDVTASHCVMSVRSHAMRVEKVTSVTKVHETGIYAPLTSTGDIVVNDVLSSCHSNLAVKTLQQSFFSLYRTLSRSVSFLLPSSLSESEVQLPFGIDYLTGAIDLFIPAKAALA
ncbi:hypothetical protein PFISCL1PPCAC_28144, partial [Pristionchus fissidentatus]